MTILGASVVQISNDLEISVENKNLFAEGRLNNRAMRVICC